MRLRGLYISAGSNDSEDAYDPFRIGLMAMKSLIHLELHFEGFEDLPPRLPIVPPALQFLLVDIMLSPSDFGTFIKAIRAPSVRTLSLAAWDWAEGPDFLETMDIEDHFPSLKI